jgi:DNA-binding NtrC family response regulator
MPTILLIDDNPAVLTALSVLFSLEDIGCVTASGPEEGLALLARQPVELVIQDMNFARDTTSGEEGEQLFHAIRERHPDLPIILLTAWTHLDAAVRLVKQGAADYLGKPWDDTRLLASVRNLLELADTQRSLRQHTRVRQREQATLRGFDLRGFVYADPATERVLTLACQIARSEVPVLITGPNGAGKERIAEVIQANSAVREGPFVTLNCGALPSELIEAELFGAEPGAYTGASRAREGKFEAADGGTLFLDEIGNLPLAGQIKLLRVLETGRFERLGGNRERQVKVRVLSATNADLPAMIRAGTFREDLYYRLNLIELALPPLAERPLDILPLAESFLSHGKRLGEAAQRALQAHAWPGNVRELKNAVTRGCLLSPGQELDPAALGLAGVAAAPRTDHEPDRA